MRSVKCEPTTAGRALTRQAGALALVGPFTWETTALAIHMASAALLMGCGGPSAGGASSPVTSRSAAVARPAEGGVRPAHPLALASCPGDMVAVAGFCIDRYEAPNQRGAVPLALQTALDGEAWCAARAKRLCTEDEWTRACEGPSGWRFPYGDEHRASACNDDRTWRPVRWAALARWPDAAAVDEAARLFQGEPSGARPACVSAEGVHDLTGNVAEWVRRSVPDPRPGYGHVLKGCYWAGCYHEPHPNCEFRNRAHPSAFRTYEAGFRCCADRRDDDLSDERSERPSPGTP